MILCTAVPRSFDRIVFAELENLTWKSNGLHWTIGS